MIASDYSTKKAALRNKLIKSNRLPGLIETRGYNEESVTTRIVKYNQEYNDFMQHKDSQSLTLMARKVLNSSQISPKVRCQPLFRLFIDTVRELMLTPLELSIFSIFLEKFGWEDKNLPPDFLFLYVGFAAKKQLCRDISYILEYLNRKISHFSENYNIWESNISQFFQVDIKEISTKFQYLSHDFSNSALNYNFYVDEILQISPPYHLDSDEARMKKKAKKREAEVEKSSSQSAPLPVLSEKDLQISNLYEKIDSICTIFFSANPGGTIPINVKKRVCSKDPYLSAIVSL